MDLTVKQNSQGASTLVVDLAKADEKVQLIVVWSWAMHTGFPQRVLRVFCGYFAHARRVMYENDVSDAMETMTAILRGCKGSVLLSRIVMQDAVSGIFHTHSELRIRENMNDMK